jgi:hypothetical protein
MRDGNGNKMLMRPRDARMLAGVCAGVADYMAGKNQDSYSG